MGFMGCIVNMYWRSRLNMQGKYVYQKEIAVSVNVQPDAAIHSLFYLWTALHISADFSTHHQEHK